MSKPFRNYSEKLLNSEFFAAMMVNLKPLPCQGVKYSLAQTLREPKRRDVYLAEHFYGSSYVNTCLNTWSRAHSTPSLEEDMLARNDTFKFVMEMPTDMLTESAFYAADKVFWKNHHLEATPFSDLLTKPDGLGKATSPGYFVRCSKPESFPKLSTKSTPAVQVWSLSEAEAYLNQAKVNGTMVALNQYLQSRGTRYSFPLFLSWKPKENKGNQFGTP